MKVYQGLGKNRGFHQSIKNFKVNYSLILIYFAHGVWEDFT